MTRRLARTHPDAIGGRIPRPCEKAEARRLWRTRKILVLDFADEGMTFDHKADAERIGRAVGVIGSAKKPRKKRTTAAVEAAEAVFAPDTQDETQRDSRGEIGGQGDG